MRTNQWLESHNKQTFQHHPASQSPPVGSSSINCVQQLNNVLGTGPTSQQLTMTNQQPQQTCNMDAPTLRNMPRSEFIALLIKTAFMEVPNNESSQLDALLDPATHTCSPSTPTHSPSKLNHHNVTNMSPTRSPISMTSRVSNFAVSTNNMFAGTKNSSPPSASLTSASRGKMEHDVLDSTCEDIIIQGLRGLCADVGMSSTNNKPIQTSQPIITPPMHMFQPHEAGPPTFNLNHFTNAQPSLNPHQNAPVLFVEQSSIPTIINFSNSPNHNTSSSFNQQQNMFEHKAFPNRK